MATLYQCFLVLAPISLSKTSKSWDLPRVVSGATAGKTWGRMEFRAERFQLKNEICYVKLKISSKVFI